MIHEIRKFEFESSRYSHSNKRRSVDQYVRRSTVATDVEQAGGVPSRAGLSPVPGDCSTVTCHVCKSQRRVLDRLNPTPSTVGCYAVVDQSKHESRDHQRQLYRLVTLYMQSDRQ